MKNHLQNINHNITQRGEEGTGNDRESNFDKGASGAVAQGADTRGFYGVVKDILQSVVTLACVFHRHILSVKPPQVYI